MDPLVLWGIVLLAVALVLLFVEVFVPSGGIIGTAAAVALIAGIVLLFRFDDRMGLVAIVASLIALPFLFGMAIKLWPHTPIGRLLSLDARQRRLMDPGDESAPQREDDLIGATGEALTDLRPVGTCRIKGHRTDCLAAGGMIDAGSKIKVVSVDGTQIKVRVEERRA